MCILTFLFLQEGPNKKLYQHSNYDQANKVGLTMDNMSRNITFSFPQSPIMLTHDKVEIIASIVIYVLLALLIVVGNGMVIAAFSFNPRLQTINNTFLVGLAVSDVLVGLVSVPLWIYFSSCQQYLTCINSPWLLTLYSTLDIFTGCASVLQLTAISVERYIAITRPISHRSYAKSTYHAMIIAAWILAFLLAGMYPIQQNQWEEAYSAFLFTTCFALPMVMIFAIYLTIFQTARGTSRAKVHPISLTRRASHSETKIATTIAVIAGLFLVAWLPFFTVNLIAQFCLPCLLPHPDILRLIRFVKWMHYSNSIANPLVYAYRNADMRRAFKRLLLACFSCGSNI